MRLRRKLLLYFAGVHLIPFVGLCFALRTDPAWLIVLELLVAVSFIASMLLARAITRPFELLETGADSIREQDFSSAFRRVGEPELDALVDLYNVMLERLRSERLRGEERHLLLMQIIELSPTGILLLDFDGRIDLINGAAARLLGASREVAGRDVIEAFGTTFRDLPPSEWRMLAAAGSQRTRVYRGEFFDRGFARSFLLVEELTDAVRASEKAAYEKVIRMMSHEINNSVGSIASLLESLLFYARDVREEDRADFERAIAVASNRLRSLDEFTRGFADVVRIPPPALHDIDLAGLLRDIVRLMEPECEARSIRVKEVLPPAALVRVDRNQMEQVILNILRNALEASADESEIEIRVETTDGVRLTVRDHGSGVSLSAQPQLFVPFFTSKPQGRGLGLTIIQEILGNHGCDFVLRNAEGGGAEFVIDFR